MAEKKHQDKAKETERLLNFARMKNLFFALIVFALSSCGNNQEPSQWDEAIIDSAIANDPIYKQLDKQEDFFSIVEKQDSLSKRTSNVSCFSGRKIDLKNTLYSKFNNCKVYFRDANALLIDIGISDLFSSRGFAINYEKGKFYVKPYHSSDIVIETEPTYKITYQKLTLDKPDY
jgi:hypothetical protein